MARAMLFPPRRGRSLILAFRLHDLFFESFNFGLCFNHVRIIVCVSCLQACKLGLKSSKLLLERLWVSACLRRSARRNFPRQHCFGEAFILLRSRERLGRCIKLGSQTAQDFQARPRIVGKRADMASLERSQFGILLIQFDFCIRELLTQKLGGVL